MEWRCEWCGKPQEENDPPCDNCGHGKFEKAVVREKSLDSDVNSTVVWVCTACGREHTKNSPPCSRCNNAKLERQRKEITDENLTTLPGEGRLDNTPNAETTTVWVCTDCGREHTKHSPPCSRCGGANLEQQDKQIGVEELSAPSYFDLVTPQYAAVLGVVLALAFAFVLGFAGVVDLPFFPDDSVPEVDNVPGEESEVNGIVLADVEDSYLEALNSQQEAGGGPALDRSQYLDDVVEYYHQQIIRAQFGDGEELDRQEISELLGQECTGPATIIDSSVTVDGQTEAELGNELADGVETPLEAEGTTTGIDTHYVDGELFLVQFVCES